ncbi:hypothetical protein Vwe01_45030 [Micromonospora andamanensis]|nr:hypothetical protein Vwe01_45030 [Micromonospora andamanensis]
MGVNVSEINTNQNPTGSDAVGVNPVAIAADRRRCSTLDNYLLEQFVGHRLLGPKWMRVPRLRRTASAGGPPTRSPGRRPQPLRSAVAAVHLRGQLRLSCLR